MNDLFNKIHQVTDMPENVHYIVHGKELKKCSTLYLINRKHVQCFYRVIETRVEVWESEKCYRNTSCRQGVSTAFPSSPKLSRVLL